MKNLVSRLAALFIDNRLLAASALIWPALCAGLRATGLNATATAVLLVAGLAASLAASIWRAITTP